MKVMGRGVTRAHPETPSVAFRGVGIKKCHFLFLAKSITGVFDFGGKSFYRVVIAVLALFVMFISLDRLFPLGLPNQSELYSQVVVDKDGHPLRAFGDAKGVWRYEVALAEVSPLYIEALLTYEDRRFWWHPGVDPLALMRALGAMIFHGRAVSGGSTITMQVGRLLHPHSKTLWGKLHQIFRALQLEWHLSKQEILTLYCNIAPFGGTIEGVQAASFTYLNKSVKDITRAEAALLAVLPQSPTRFRPDLHPMRALAARNKVMQRLVDYGVWTAAQVAQAQLEPVYAIHNRVEPHAALLAERLRAGNTQNVIATTIDRSLQLALEDYLESYIQTQPARTSAAVLVVDNHSGAVRAYIGTADFGNLERFGHVDMVQATRSPGSTLKPFLYGLALDEGLIHEQSLLMDAPLAWSSYQPKNFSGGFIGPVSAAEALQRSLNIPAVDVLDRLGPAQFVGRLNNAGLALNIPGGTPNLAVILGGAGASLEQLVATYTALANQGVAHSLRFSPPAKPTEGRYLMSEQAAWVVYNILSDVPRPGRLRQVNAIERAPQLAWKTGTSYGMRDAWAIGFDANVTIGVWVGRPDGSFVPDNTGRTAAGPLLHTIADQVIAKVAPIAKPEGVTKADICWPLGTLASTQPEAFCHQRKSAWLIQQTAPPTWAALNEPIQQNPLTLWVAGGQQFNSGCLREGVSQTQLAVWPLVLEPWLPWAFKRANLLPPLAKGCSASQSLAAPIHIENIMDNNIYQAASNQTAAPQLRLHAEGGVGRYHWYVNGQYQFSHQPNQSRVLTLNHPGPLQLVVVDDGGNLDKRDIVVR